MTALLHELTAREASAICEDLGALAEPILVVACIVDHTVHLYPLEVVSTEVEVIVLAAFLGRTDMPVHWHPVRAT